MNRAEKRRSKKAYEKRKQYIKSGFMPKDPDGILDMIFVDPELDKMVSEEFGWYNRPVIYAFRTKLVPNAIKIGFTFRYHERIEEWREKYPDLEIVGGPWDAFFLMSNTLYFFRDESVHQNAEGNNHLFRRLAEKDFAENVYPSKEFFETISEKNEKLTKEAIANLVFEVRESILNGERLYHYFKRDEAKKKVSVGMPENNDTFEANDRQNAARKEAKLAIESGVRKWLLAAVMRFGKTFTSLMISKDMNAKLTVVLTGKADVRCEWRRAIFHEQLFTKRLFVEFASGKGADHKVYVSGNYDGNRLWKEEMPLTDNFFKNLIDNGYSVIVFGTLQDFAGNKVSSGREIKRKHKELFNFDIDLLIVDETHYGARGVIYGQTIKKTAEDIEENDGHLKEEEKDMLEESRLVEALPAKYQLHLSGTPYRIMTSGEFEADGCKIISVVSYQDQLKDKNDWLKANPDKDESDCPLFGLPTMRMYGIKLTKECREILRKSLDAGNSLSDSISTLFKCDRNGKLIYEDQIKGFLGAFFNGLLKKIHEKNQFVANHIVTLLPSVAACHAVADIFKDIVGTNDFNVYVAVQGKVGNTFKRWNEECKDAFSLNAALVESEKNGKRTIVFTVNRLTTGTTIPLWDTMLYLRGGENSESYDQARFRLSSKNVEEYEVNGKTMKVCKKNEMLFFDFQPNRMLSVRADAIRSEKRGESEIEEEIDQELKQISYKNLDSFGDKFKEYECVDFMKALYEFDKRSFADSMYKYDALLESQDIKKMIEKFSGNGFGSNVHKLSPFDDNGNSDTDDDSPETEENGNGKGNKHSSNNQNRNNSNDLKKKLKNVMLRLHFFVACLRNVFIDNGIDGLYEHLVTNEEDRLLLENEFSITLDDILLIRKSMTKEMKDFFCGECFRVTHYLNSDEYEPLAKVEFISKRCGKVSESGVAVPSSIAKKMLDDTLEHLKKRHNNGKILEIGSIYGEYLIEAWKMNDPELMKKFRVLPLNGITGIIAKRVCNILKVPEDIIMDNLIRDEKTKMVDIKLFIDENKNEKIIKTLKEMKISAIVGNPPYDHNNQQIYTKFYLLAQKLAKTLCMIFPSKWQRPGGGKNLLDLMNTEEVKKDRQIVFIDNRTNVFQDANGASETNIILWESGYDNGLDGKQRLFKDGENPEIKELGIEGGLAIKPLEIQQLAAHLENYIKISGSLEQITSKSKPYGLRRDFYTSPEKYGFTKDTFSETPIVCGIKIYCRVKPFTVRFSAHDFVFPKYSDGFKGYKVFVGNAWGNYDEKKYLGGSYADVIVAEPYEAASETFQETGNFETKEMAIKHAKYIITPFARACLYETKETRLCTTCWKNVPAQDYSEDWWDESVESINKHLYEKYNLPNNVRDFIDKWIQPLTVDNIINYNDKQ